MNTRMELLNSLLEFDKPLSEILPRLNSSAWDSQQAIIILQRRHLTKILQRYLSHQVLASDVENWANAIEGREDIQGEGDFAEGLDAIIFDLANPFLSRPLSPDVAQEYLARLETSSMASL